MDIAFEYLDPERAERWLPEMFGILYANMSRIAPTGESEAEDQRAWLAYLRPALQAGTRVLLIRVDGALAGYLQCSVRGDVMLIEEIELAPSHQRTALFGRFLRHFARELPEDIRGVEAYIDKRNGYSRGIAEKLGFRISGENASGRSWKLRADAAELRMKYNI